MKRLDRSGRRHGRLLVLDQWKSIHECNRQLIYWLCRCDCGNEVWVRADFLRDNGTGTTSCGCRHDENLAKGREMWRLTRPKSEKFPGLKSRTPEYQKAANQQYYEEHKDQMLAEHAEWQRSEAGHNWRTNYMRTWYDPEKQRAYNHAAYQANPARYTGYNIKRRHRLEQRTPSWAKVLEIVLHVQSANRVAFYCSPLQWHDVIDMMTGRAKPIKFFDSFDIPGEENNHKRTRMRRHEQELCEAPYNSTTGL